VEQALALLAGFARGDLHLVAPEHIRSEVPAAFFAATRRATPRLSVDRARRAIDHFLAIGVQTYGDDDLIRNGALFAERHGISYYDALYLALADRMAARLVTADARLYRRISMHPNVIWIADFSGTA
jgi:predicted nucleic acid-binding protein